MPNERTTHQTAPATTLATTPASTPASVSATAETVRRIWAELLEVDAESIDIHQSDFFELGGYSLLALQAIGRLLAEQGVDEVEAVELEGALLNRLFEDATPLAQAECLLTTTTPTTP
ncbi:phosphopantetheine-binding protein [Streptomyces sp. NPDC002054]|uniref:phosphopantetheine-binding protein n=1 Tax=Streptomyces sp. NPDC002054 TaxID=3154663 RepID=UPI0033194289